MAAPTPATSDRSGRGPWLGFAAVGLLAATWAARIPAVQDRLDLSTGELAVALLAVEGGALLGLPLGGRLAVRWGSRRSAVLGFVVYPAALVLAVTAPSLGWLAVGLAVWAATNSVLDVALNAQGVALERRLGRPLLNRLHAAQGGGSLVGALLATGAAALDVPLLLHVGVVAAAVVGIGLRSARAAPPEPPRSGERGRSPRARPGRRLVLVGLVAFCAFLIDAAATSWVAVQLRTDHDASPALAGAGYLVLMVGIVLGRLGGDHLLAHRSRQEVVRACGLLVGIGTAVVVLAPVAVLAIVGWLVVGLGVAPLAPAVLAAAPDAAGPNGSEPPVAIATATGIGYVGSFSGPPAIGALAGPVGLSAALALVAVAGGAVALLARCLPAAGKPASAPSAR